MVSENNTFKVLVLPGDGVGPEVIAEARKVLSAISEASHIDFDISEALFGGCSIDVHGVAITEEVLDLARQADAVLAGAVGGPKWGTGKIRPEEGLLQLRHGLQAYANLRPCRFASKSLQHLSVLPTHVVDGTDFTIVRENCGGAYFGTKVEEDDFASDSWAYSRAEVERISHVAASLALEHNPPLKVISSDKANVLASGRLWRRIVSETFTRDYPQITLSHQLADSAAMMMMRNPRSFNGILLTDNTFGDILSDEASVIPGSLGLLPSASLSGIPAEGTRVKGFYEPVHGSAPDIAGRGISNPIATILSLSMMLRYSFGLKKEADALEVAVQTTLDSKDIGGLELRTGDIGGKASTVEIGDAISKLVGAALRKGN